MRVIVLVTLTAGLLASQMPDKPVTDKQVQTILSLPVFAELTNEQIAYVADQIVAFFQTT